MIDFRIKTIKQNVSRYPGYIKEKQSRREYIHNCVIILSFCPGTNYYKTNVPKTLIDTKEIERYNMK